MSGLVIGLTGGIGSGKSAASDAFAALGVDVVDADVIARDVVAPSSEGLQKITAHFGDTVLLPDGTLDRAAIRERVFAAPDEKAWLDGLLHPMIREHMQTAINAATSPYCILAVPLLVENNLVAMVDRVVVVDCPESLQLSRALKRDGSSEQTIRNIIAAQASREARLAVADDIIDNSGSLDALKTRVRQLHLNYCRLSGVS